VAVLEVLGAHRVKEPGGVGDDRAVGGEAEVGKESAAGRVRTRG